MADEREGINPEPDSDVEGHGLVGGSVGGAVGGAVGRTDDDDPDVEGHALAPGATP